MLISESILERAGLELRGEWDEWLPKVVIDSRKVKKGELFWALPGSSGHGQDFAFKALESGASVIAVEKEWAQKNEADLVGKTHLVMKDTLAGLQDLAREVRRSVGGYVFGLTGSNGKTTTRELLSAALSTAGKTASSEGNYNNHIGLPLTILNLEGDENFVVLEMGANHVGEIQFLCELAHPEFGLITNIGDAHVGEFGGFDKLKQAKGELFDSLAENDGLAIVNLDDPQVVDNAGKVKRKVGYTLSEVPDFWTSSVYQGKIVEKDAWSRATIEVEGMRMMLQLPGTHWAQAALAAYAGAVELGAEIEEAFRALGQVKPVEGRGRIYDLGDGIQLLDDSYNANVASIKSVLSTLACRPGRRIAVLGDILELGVFEEEEHRKVGAIESLEYIDRIYFVGHRMSRAADEAEAAGHRGVVRVALEEVELLAKRLDEDLSRHAGIVVKGSRLTGLDRVVRDLLAMRGTERLN